jgi:hypothetical protein
MFSNNIDCEILGKSGMSFEKNFKILFKESMTIMLSIKSIQQSIHLHSIYNV